MSLIISSERNFLWPVGTDNENAAALNSPHEVKKQACRRFVDPLQVIEYQDQWTLSAQLHENGCHLLENSALVGVVRCIGSRRRAASCL